MGRASGEKSRVINEEGIDHLESLLEVFSPALLSPASGPSGHSPSVL